MVLGLQIVGATAALIRAAGAALRVDGAGVAMRGDQVVDLGLHVRVDVQVLAEQVLAEGETLEQLVAGVRRRVAAVLLLRLVGL